MSGIEVVVAVLVGVVAGAFAGLLGVGGGIVMVPAMVILLDRTQHVAQGTSLLVIVVTALAGTYANRSRGFGDLRAAVWLGAGGAAGAIAGALLALEVVDERALRRIFGVLLILVAFRTFVRKRPAEGS